MYSMEYIHWSKVQVLVHVSSGEFWMGSDAGREVPGEGELTVEEQYCGDEILLL